MKNMAENENNLQKKIITIPNILSCFRLCLIPFFVWTYCVKENYVGTVGILILSGATDVVDGFIARTFHMISDVGKVLDPVADKLTQAVMLVCLLTRFPFMWVPLILMVIKEICMLITGYLVIRKTGVVYGANWHGKAATVLLYGMMILHIIWYDIPALVSNITIGMCVVMMMVSFILYGIRNMKAIHKEEQPN